MCHQIPPLLLGCPWEMGVGGHVCRPPTCVWWVQHGVIWCHCSVWWSPDHGLETRDRLAASGSGQRSTVDTGLPWQPAYREGLMVEACRFAGHVITLNMEWGGHMHKISQYLFDSCGTVKREIDTLSTPPARSHPFCPLWLLKSMLQLQRQAGNNKPLLGF